MYFWRLYHEERVREREKESEARSRYIINETGATPQTMRAGAKKEQGASRKRDAVNRRHIPPPLYAVGELMYSTRTHGGWVGE